MFATERYIYATIGPIPQTVDRNKTLHMNMVTLAHVTFATDHEYKFIQWS